MEMRSHLGRVRGLGSANEGVGHWWMQRLTGIALVPLVLWFAFSMVGLVGADLATVKTWVGLHGNPVLLILLIGTVFYHAHLGLQVIVEDYIHGEGIKTASIILIKLGAVFLAAFNIFAVIRLTFGS